MQIDKNTHAALQMLSIIHDLLHDGDFSGSNNEKNVESAIKFVEELFNNVKPQDEANV